MKMGGVPFEKMIYHRSGAFVVLVPGVRCAPVVNLLFNYQIEGLSVAEKVNASAIAAIIFQSSGQIKVLFYRL